MENTNNKNFLKIKQSKSIFLRKAKLNKLKLNNSIKVKYYKYYYQKKYRFKSHKFKNNDVKKKTCIAFNIIGLVLFLTSYYLYYLSLEKCLDGEDICSKNWNWIIIKFKQLMISSVLIIILIFLIIFDLLSKLHLIHFILAFSCFYRYSHSSYFHDHGALNLIGLFSFLFASIILLVILKVIFSILRIKYKYKIISVIILVVFYNILDDPINCYDWPKGLNNTYIENNINIYGCQVKFPKRCDYKILSFTQDFSKISHLSCSNKAKNSRKNILIFSKSRYVNNNTLQFGFPLTNNDEGKKDGWDDIILKKYTAHHLIDMDKNIPKKLSTPEYIVDFSRDPLGDLIINLNFNETLSVERKKFEKNTVPYSDNIIILYIDSISRNNALRKLKKTINFIEKFITYKGGYNKNFPEENFHSFQFFKYHSLKGYTAENFPPLFYGNYQKTKGLIRITK